MTYSVTKSSRSSHHSLIHRGANGEVLGRDVRVIENHPDSKVDIRGIDNCQISAITLVTDGVVTTSIKNEVIVSMHQWACHGKNKTINFHLRSRTTIIS